MRFIAEIDIMPLPNLLDPQGKTIMNTLHNLNYKNISNIRIGKHISIILTAENIEKAKEKIHEIAKKVLINPIVEYYTFSIKEFEK